MVPELPFGALPQPGSLNASQVLGALGQQVQYLPRNETKAPVAPVMEPQPLAPMNTSPGSNLFASLHAAGPNGWQNAMRQWHSMRPAPQPGMGMGNQMQQTRPDHAQMLQALASFFANQNGAPPPSGMGG